MVHTDTNSATKNDLVDHLDNSDELTGISLDLELAPFPDDPIELDKRVPTRRPNTFGTAEPSTTVSATGINNIDALLYGSKWQSTDVTYGFTDDFVNDYENSYHNYSEHESGFEALNAAQEDATRSWYSMYEDISDLNMMELTGESDRDATMRLAESDAPEPTAYAFYPGNYVEAGDSWYNPNSYNSPEMGDYAFTTFGHELGHAFGLKHGHETGGVSSTALDSDRDSLEFSIMTYKSYVGQDLNTIGGYVNESGGYPQSPMMYDIAAIQQMYGADFDTNSGDSEYTFSTTTGEMSIDGEGQGTPAANRVFRTVWDGNGTDTYNFSNYNTNLSISLEPGDWSDLDINGNTQRAQLNFGYDGTGYNSDSIEYARGHIFNALQHNGDSRSLIENATGGSGDDSIVGNTANNSLEGGIGNDTISGKTGDDSLAGGSGSDVLAGNSGNDTLDGGNNDDNLNGGSGEDDLSGGSGNDILRGLRNNDTIVGNTGNDNINGGSGNDSLNANEGMDLLRGGAGRDTIAGGGGDDSLLGGGGSDSLTGTSGEDVLKGEAGNDMLNGGSDQDSIFGGPGRDTFVLSTNLNTSDRDIIRDFELGSDRLGVSDLSLVNSLSVMNNGADTATASVIRNDNGQQVAILSGIIDITLGDLDFTEV